MEIQAGDIAFSGRYSPSFYDRGVMWATNSRWSHCFPIVGDVFGDLSVLEADLDITLVSFKVQYVTKTEDYYEIWRPSNATPEQILAAGKYCYENFAEEPYGFLQPLWFLLRAFLTKLGIKLKNKNWFGGIVCSGLLFEYILALGGEYTELLKGRTSDTTDPEDLYALMKSRLDLFQFVLQRV